MTISFTLEDFHNVNYEQFQGRLSSVHSINHTSLTSLQTKAWEKEFEDLHRFTNNKDGRILFEYSIPGLPKAIDVVLLYHSKIFVIEYKVNSTSYEKEDVRQVNGYALRLKYFHSTSNNNWIIPILVSTEAICVENKFQKSEDDMVYETIKCNSSNLIDTINKIDSIIPCSANNNWETNWETGIYKQSPTIIEAACNVWRQNNVRDFNIGISDERTRLAAEDYIKTIVVPQTINRKGKSIVFVTGVPGAGKTLVGLNTSVALQSYGASMLSGNGPLVEVLTAALKRDLKKNKNNLNKAKSQISIESIIRDAYGYKKEIFEKRLNYIPGGEVKLHDNVEEGSQHIIIFDEAQRAWTQKKMIRPGQTGRKEWQEEQFPFSEPGLLLWDMNQMDWGVFICLVGGGQEINTGEAGICEWLRTIEKDKTFENWHIYMAKDFRGEEYNGTNGDTVDYYREKFEFENRITYDKSLYLSACQRSNRTDKVSYIIQMLLDCNQLEAKQTYCQIRDKFKIYLTRDIEEAKAKLRERKKQLENLNLCNNENEDSIRIGILMSSKAARLRPLGFEIKKVSEYLNKVSNWFLDSSDYINSSNFLEIALNEFFVQGLELDLDAVIWDADFRYNKNKNQWNYFDFDGREWRNIDKENEIQLIKRHYMKNAYRVLLTRARAGMIIVVPKGSAIVNGKVIDSSRKPEYYDSTYEYLKGIGFDEI